MNPCFGWMPTALRKQKFWENEKFQLKNMSICMWFLYYCEREKQEERKNEREKERAREKVEGKKRMKIMGFEFVQETTPSDTRINVCWFDAEKKATKGAEKGRHIFMYLIRLSLCWSAKDWDWHTRGFIGVRTHKHMNSFYLTFVTYFLAMPLRFIGCSTKRTYFMQTKAGQEKKTACPMLSFALSYAHIFDRSNDKNWYLDAAMPMKSV